MTWAWLNIFIVVGVIGVIWAIYAVVRRIGADRRKIALLLDALENGDTSIKFPVSRDRDVNVMLNRISEVLKRVRIETGEKERYYELILDRVGAGVLSVYDNGVVFQVNRAALSLLGLDVLTHLRQLERVSAELMARIEAAGDNDRLSVEVVTEGRRRTLSVNVSAITLQHHRLRIIVLDDISDSLDRKEVDSWIKLTRVMTHEIMNSLGPITSLSETLAERAGDESEELREGLSTIAVTGKSLVSFVSSYRRLVYTPTVEPRLFSVKPFLERMMCLAMQYVASSDVVITIKDCDNELIAYADENMMGQVLANLLKNAVEAVAGTDGGRVELNAYCDDTDTVTLTVSNNGPHITEDVADEIFVPFFTTKNGGTGIGLSISRRMVQLNGGSLALAPYTDADAMTTFVITLP